jgi:hypothetical protein
LDCNLRAHSSPKGDNGKVNKRNYSENQPCTKLKYEFSPEKISPKELKNKPV